MSAGCRAQVEGQPAGVGHCEVAADGAGAAEGGERGNLDRACHRAGVAVDQQGASADSVRRAGVLEHAAQDQCARARLRQSARRRSSIPGNGQRARSNVPLGKIARINRKSPIRAGVRARGTGASHCRTPDLPDRWWRCQGLRGNRYLWCTHRCLRFQRE